MVSKIAVIALVAIVATPILLGYAFNLSETTETEYRPVGQPTNVTDLLQTGTSHTYANANTYDLNSNFFYNGYRTMPIFNSITTATTSLKMNQGEIYLTPGSYSATHINNITGGQVYYYIGGSGSDVTFRDLDHGGNITYYSVPNVTSFIYDPATQKGYFTNANGAAGSFTFNAYNDYLYFKNDGASPVKIYTSSSATSDNHYVNLAGGFYFVRTYGNIIDLPDYSRSVMLTLDLGAYSNTYYKMTIKLAAINSPASDIYLERTGGNWYAWTYLDPDNKIQLYTDPSKSSNTYQMILEYAFLDSDLTNDQYARNITFRYVGDWPTLIGPANYFLEYHLGDTSTVPTGNEPYLTMLQLYTDNEVGTILMRVDAAYFRAFTYQTITNQVYSPDTFKENPITTIDKINIYGTSLIFGGSTYTVSDGKITLDGHKIPIDGLKFSSIPKADGTYDNQIGNTVISNSASPSTITFIGSWSASINTDSLQSQTVTKTEWHVGEFGWDGVDQNFLIVGLITCLGVFVGLGIYARKSRSGGIIPLMIVTGCAAAVFFIML